MLFDKHKSMDVVNKNIYYQTRLSMGKYWNFNQLQEIRKILSKYLSINEIISIIFHIILGDLAKSLPPN